MAKFGFGLNVNETAQENGYDQYQTTLKESLGAVAADNWELNPAMATFKRWKMYEAKSISEEGERSPRNQPILRVNRDKLNKQYSSLGLYFEQDEYQSVVDIMVNSKIEENERQSIMSRGPEGSFNPLSGGFYVGAAKLAVGIGVSFLDPINIGASFIPVVGQTRFAQIVARTGLKTGRAVRGAVEGAVGATLLEPLIYSTAQKIQADYDLVDSFMNIGFGTIIGTGLHVGAGALKDIGTAQKFEAQIIKNRKNLNLQNEIVKDTLDVPTKINIGESFNIFDVNGNIVNAKITSISSSGNSVKVKLPNGSEQIINLDARSVVFQNIKSSKDKIAENVKPSPASLYSVSKRFGELLIENDYPKKKMCTVLRVSWVYGPPIVNKKIDVQRGPIPFILTHLFNLNNEKLIFKSGKDFEASFTYIKDVCYALEKLINYKKFPHPVFHLGSGKNYKLSEVCKIINKNFKKKLLKMGKGFLPWTSDSVIRGPLISNLNNKIKIKYSLEDGLKEYIKFLRD